MLSQSSWREVAHGQAGLVTRGQLGAGGLSDHRVARLVSAGDLTPVQRGVYLHPPAAHGAMTAIWLAVLAGGPYCFAYRRSAAMAWGLDGFDSERPGAGPPGGSRAGFVADTALDVAAAEVAVARGRNARGGVRRLRDLQPGDVVRLGDLRVTSARRTLRDLATLGDRDRLEAALESALRRRLVREEDIRAAGAACTGRGAPLYRAVLAERPDGAPPTDSEAETRFLQICRRAGLPAPERQVELVAGRRYRLDFAWRESRIGAEVDGRDAHGPDRLGADLRRQNRIVLDDWLLLRFTWEDVAVYGQETAAVVGQALRASGLRLPIRRASR